MAEATEQETNIHPHTDSESEGIKLPPNFLLGASSSAHQVEGDNKHNDWWQYEQEGKLPRSGLAADHYHRFEEDFTLAKQLGLDAMRISVEWSRIEPQEGKWSVAEIEHYRKVLKKLKSLGMTRMVTLHHFTLPKWMADRGGFESKEGVEAFARFAWFVAQNLGDEIDLWATINEPETYSFMSYRLGVWPPFRKNVWDTVRVVQNLIAAHKAAYQAIKETLPEAKVGIVTNNSYYEPFRRNNFWDRLAAYFSAKFNNHYLLEKIRRHLDFIGLNYYFYRRVKFDRRHGYTIMDDESLPRSDLGWVIYPEGMYYLLKSLKRYGKPVYVTENGLADRTDGRRYEFIRDHLHWVKKAIDFGTDVRGYFYWSLTDTYEWHDGFGPKFGLVEVDFANQKRKIKPSGRIFKELYAR